MRGKIVSRNELARLLEVVPSTINKWSALGLPNVKTNTKGREWQFNTADCVQWLMQHRVRMAELGGDPHPRSSMRLRKLAAETTIKEIEAQRRVGQFVPIAWAIEIQEQAFVLISKRLAVIAPRAAKLVAKEPDVRRCQRIIEREVDDARREIVAMARKLDQSQ